MITNKIISPHPYPYQTKEVFKADFDLFYPFGKNLTENLGTTSSTPTTIGTETLNCNSNDGLHIFGNSTTYLQFNNYTNKNVFSIGFWVYPISDPTSLKKLLTYS